MWVITLFVWHGYYTGNWWYFVIDSLAWWIVQLIFEGDDSKHDSKRKSN
jgi:hypothetical protein